MAFVNEVLSFQALEIHPHDAGVLEMKCQSLISLHEWDCAVEVGRKAVTARPTWYEALQTLGRAHVGRGDVEEARCCFKKAFHIRPDDRELLEEDLLWSHSLFLHQQAEREAIREEESKQQDAEV